MPGRNFEKDSITHPIPNDQSFGAQVEHAGVYEVEPGGYVNIERDDLAWHFVAWVPLEVNASVRTTTLHLNPDNTLKPTYVQSEKGINIGPGEEWGGRHVAIFILKEEMSERHKTATPKSV